MACKSPTVGVRAWSSSHEFASRMQLEFLVVLYLVDSFTFDETSILILARLKGFAN